MKVYNEYDVQVGNIGNVYHGTSKDSATLIFDTYVDLSNSDSGRASHEDVILMENNEIVSEFYWKPSGKRISQPGKFEGELDYVPSLWSVANEGLSADVYIGETLYSFVTLCAIGCTNSTLFGAVLHEDNNGFVYCHWFATEEEYNNELRRMEDESRDLAEME